ncbi:MAG TPA: histidine phosphatase family protein [Ktedonobacteraceae bacterium]|nr:histidine phosphatase family protein [Ktedonobacteraceae bacterium]
MSTVWFIRHGVSQSNAGELTFSPNFTGLTRSGMAQAVCIAEAFPHTSGPSLIVTSKYIRTQQTAFPTMKRFYSAKREQWKDVHEFTYLSRAHSTRMTMQERRPLVEAYWQRNDPLYSDGEEAESFVRFISRVSSVVERLRYSKEEFIAIFTHGYVMRAVWWLLHTRVSKIDAAGMRAFHELLDVLPLPNGAILPLQLSHSREFLVGDVLLSHLSQTKEKKHADKNLLKEEFYTNMENRPYPEFAYR